ncbi:MAG: M20/M25/M40 family metallo-hydrolase [Melioribacteraceae bacterium]|nr:M20/M25/M40 family metallo-hydrolase [Melioribacteraceae bacterium]MCF8354491.1 M20/M25/M40 family metallo-hydrolase [Melioribacteraceae bacterium]MCF8394101.1 M20/M25/M40 family metallo-hydrolase [Melioribacteraceae bacterium]MCF8419847.1 M20/M25/M40 family metallo-hydrolase [Melioribacteraceae bacterium]
MKKLFILTVLIFIASCSQEPQQAGLNFIESENLINTVKVLASEEYEGRLSGSDGYMKAADYVSNQFKEIGLEPFSKESFFQKFNIEYNEVFPPVSLKLIDNQEVIKVYKLGDDYIFRGFTGSGEITAPVVFAGYGISVPGYDDYANIDAAGKIIIAFKYNPKWKLNDVNWSPGTPRYKSKVAAENGALGIMFVSFPNDENPQKTIGSTMHGDGVQNENFPQLHIDLDVAEDFLTGSGFTLKELQTIIDDNKKPYSIELKTSSQILVNAKYDKEKETVNVIGILPGIDEKMKDEYVILGAHLDHVGQQGKEIYFPGANDNASGSAAVMEIAKAFVGNNIRPKRSIMFVLFASEESGLEGSSFLASNLGIDTNKVAAMLNMDCVGHGDSIRLGNGKSALELWGLAKSLDSTYTKMTVNPTWSGGGADAAPFHQKGIPALYFVTTNSYTHLHYMTDTPGTLNPELYEKITELAFLTTYNVADGNYERENIVK